MLGSRWSLALPLAAIALGFGVFVAWGADEPAVAATPDLAPGASPAAISAAAARASGRSRACLPDNDGLVLPAGFCAGVFHEGLGRVRHLDVAPNGDVFVATEGGGRGRRGGGGGIPGGVVVLRDTDGDGVADLEERWDEPGGSEVRVHENWVYIAPNDRVVRFPRAAGSLTPSGPAETVVSGLATGGGHSRKSFAIDDAGNMYVNIGSSGNICTGRGQQMGLDPCPELDNRAGIWRFDAHRTGQTQADGIRYATGVRNAVGLAINPLNGRLYAAVHGRDSLDELFPQYFTQEEGNELPSEEFILVEEGGDYGWPYCFYDHIQGRKVLGPEYGGDGDQVGRCAAANAPLTGMPGHWAPNDLEFYTGDQFPARYYGGAFIAFHGSWNRTPVQAGFNVVFVPMENGAPSGPYEVFADNFAGHEVSGRGNQADHRPTGLATGTDGSLYVSDSVTGRIWKIVYQGG